MIYLLRLGLAAFVMLASTIVVAQGLAWPARPIRWIVPYSPGGIADIVTRLVLQKVTEQAGWTIVVDNKPGANSILGADLAAKAPPDGYTFLTVIAAHAANATLYAGKLPYDVVKSFEPVSVVGIAPLLMAASNDLPANDVKELIAYGKANPGKISFGSSGVGAAAHLTTELFKQAADIDMVHVPYKGAAPALQDLIAGNIQVLVDVPTTLMPQVRSGQIKALGIFSAKRVAAAAEVPTVAEAGGPPIEASTWVLFLAPAGTSREIVNRMSAEAAKAVTSPQINSRFEAMGVAPVGDTPEAARKFLGEEIAKWAKVISTAGVTAEQ